MLDQLVGNADKIVVTSSEGFLQRLMNSVVGVLIGIALFLASFFILWWNEGNIIAEKGAFEEMRKVVQKAKAETPAPKQNGKLIWASATLKSDEKVGDAPYLKPGEYLAVERFVEMYQWTEKSETETKTKVGGSKTKETTYTYSLGWASGRIDSSSFKQPAGHTNPPLEIDGKKQVAKKTTFGKFDGSSILDRLSPTENLPLSKDNLVLGKETKAGSIKQGLLYFKRDPKKVGDSLGDTRISYRVVRQGIFSIMARQLPSNKLGLWKAKNGKEKFLIEEGTKQPTQMIERGKEAASGMAWILRFVGLFVMWLGLNLCAGPVVTMLDFIPFLGSAGRFVLGLIFGVVALILSAITMLISMVAHSPILLALVVAGVVGGVVFYARGVKARRKAAVENRVSPDRRVSNEPARPEDNQATAA